MEWRTHWFVKLVYVLQGRGVFHLGRQSEEFATGDVIVVAPKTRNRIEDDPVSASSLYICCLDPKLFAFDDQVLQNLPTQVARGDGHFGNRVASILRRMVHAQEVDNAVRSVALVADAMKLAQTVCQRNQKTQGKAGRSSETTWGDERSVVEQYITNLPSHFFEETSIDDVAERLGIARRTFTKLFAEITGETWLNHVRRLAIEHAKRRLEHSDLPITSIAFECGFNELSTFYRQFKTHCGVSPGKYRASVSK
jgi:AraC family L-rhamnose operon regulatory protein RhaS